MDQTTLMFRCNFCAMKQKVSSTITTLYGTHNIKSDDRAEKQFSMQQLNTFMIGQNLEDLKNDTKDKKSSSSTRTLLKSHLTMIKLCSPFNCLDPERIVTTIAL